MNTSASSNSEPGRPRARGGGAAILSFIFVLGSLAMAVAADVSVSPSVAGLFVGEEKVVEGTVTTAEREINVVRLHLGKSPQELVVSLVIGMLNTFPPAPEQYYLGKTVRVAGTIRSFRGTPEIVIRDAADIRVVGGAAAAAGPGAGAEVAPASAAAAAPISVAAEHASQEASLLQRIEALAERVRLLEDRVHQLEGGIRADGAGDVER